jgi:hypothetical protein
MCGREIAGKGILCDKCDKPRAKKSEAAVASADVESPKPEAEAAAAPQSPAAPPPAAASKSQPSRNAEATARDLDPFPKAPIVPFPVESASPAITSVVNVLVAAGVASVFIGPDRSVKFVSDEARKLFDAPMSDLNMKFIEQKTGLRLGDLSVPTSAGLRVSGRNILYTLVPMSGGASGAVLVFRHADPMNESHASFVTYVRETVIGPLRSTRESLLAAARTRQDHFLADSAAGIDQILSSLEMAPEIEEPLSGFRPMPTVSEVVRRVADRFRAYADLKGIDLVVDVQDLEERFSDHDQLSESLAILMDNALHYVPASGQVVIGVRWMEHKGKPLLLFFVMDNGPLVPEPMRQSIFEPSFVWNPSGPDRSGRGLFRCREFALAHAGSVWVEAKTGKACTFFLRVRPDGVH